MMFFQLQSVHFEIDLIQKFLSQFFNGYLEIGELKSNLIKKFENEVKLLKIFKKIIKKIQVNKIIFFLANLESNSWEK